jgi:hypothetical protein
VGQGVGRSFLRDGRKAGTLYRLPDIRFADLPAVRLGFLSSAGCRGETDVEGGKRTFASSSFNSQRGCSRIKRDACRR